MNIDKLSAQLKTDEDERSKPYKDTVGKTTIGVGRNLDDVGLSPDEIQYLLGNDIARVKADLDRAMPWWSQMTDARQNVLANMCFNLGLSRLGGFVNTLAAMKAGKYDAAADGMLASKWATQVGARAQRLAATMRTGVF
jgi:lysozyme